MLLEPVHSKDNRVVGKWCNIGLELFLVSVHVYVELCHIGNLLCGTTTVSEL